MSKSQINENKKSLSVINRDYEFDAELENHEMGNRNIYRLYYMDYRRCGETRGMGSDNLHITDWPFKPFILPQYMSREDSFKVLSYLTDYIEKTFKLEECSHASVRILNDALDLERLGFRKVDVNVYTNLDKIVDLYTISGRILLFKKSEHYPRYIEWYSKGVTLEEVKKIYESIGMEFHDLEIKEKTENNLKLKKWLK